VIGKVMQVERKHGKAEAIFCNYSMQWPDHWPKDVQFLNRYSDRPFAEPATYLLIETPKGRLRVDDGNVILYFPEDGAFEVIGSVPFSEEWQVVEPPPEIPTSQLLLTFNEGNWAVFQGTYQAILAALRDRGDVNMAGTMQTALLRLLQHDPDA